MVNRKYWKTHHCLGQGWDCTCCVAQTHSGSTTMLSLPWSNTISTRKSWSHSRAAMSQRIALIFTSCSPQARFPLLVLTGDRFPLPVNMGRVDEWKPVTRQLGPLTQAVNSGSVNRASARHQLMVQVLKTCGQCCTVWTACTAPSSYWYQFILLGDRGNRVWETCLRFLCSGN